MAHQREHRRPGDLEVGAGDVFLPSEIPHAAARPPPPEWLTAWETRRPKWLQEMVSECVAVFMFTWFGFGATAAMLTTEASNAGGTALTVAMCYATGIALGVLVAGPNSGGHLHPGFTISFALFKGFPWRKVPQYIIAQLLGSFIGGLVVYGSFKPQLVAMTQKLVASGKRSEIFSPAGPSGTFVVYEPPNSTMGVVFMNEIFGDIVLGIIVYSVLDPSNVFVIPTMVPVYIGLGFFAAIAAYAGNGIAYNTARDLGARFAAACFWGTGVFPSRITAEAVLTNIAGVIIGGAVQKFWLSDSIRPHTEHATQLAAAQEKEREAHLHRVLTARSSERGGMLTRVLSGRLSSNGDAAEKNPA